MCFRKVRYICVISDKNSTENISLERTNAFTRTLLLGFSSTSVFLTKTISNPVRGYRCNGRLLFAWWTFGINFFRRLSFLSFHSVAHVQT